MDPINFFNLPFDLRGVIIQNLDYESWVKYKKAYIESAENDTKIRLERYKQIRVYDQYKFRSTITNNYRCDKIIENQEYVIDIVDILGNVDEDIVDEYKKLQEIINRIKDTNSRLYIYSNYPDALLNRKRNLKLNSNCYPVKSGEMYIQYLISKPKIGLIHFGTEYSLEQIKKISSNDFAYKCYRYYCILLDNIQILLSSIRDKDIYTENDILVPVGEFKNIHDIAKKLKNKKVDTIYLPYSFLECCDILKDNANNFVFIAILGESYISKRKRNRYEIFFPGMKEYYTELERISVDDYIKKYKPDVCYKLRNRIIYR